MTRDTGYAFVFPDRTVGRIRNYHGHAFGDIVTELPNWHWSLLDDRVAVQSNRFTQTDLRSWLDALPRLEMPETLLDLAEFIDDIGLFCQPEIALRLFIEFLIKQMALCGAIAVEIYRL
jgi:hypothetical protein